MGSKNVIASCCPTNVGLWIPEDRQRLFVKGTQPDFTLSGLRTSSALGVVTMRLMSLFFLAELLTGARGSLSKIQSLGSASTSPACLDGAPDDECRNKSLSSTQTTAQRSAAPGCNHIVHFLSFAGDCTRFASNAANPASGRFAHVCRG